MSEPPAPPPEDPAAALRRAAQLREAGDDAGAAAIYRTLAEAHPGQAGLWAMLGDALRVSGDAAGGADALGKASMLAPEDHDIAVEWALARLEAGDTAGALDALAGREAALVDSPRGQAVLGDALLRVGKPGDALTYYRRALLLEPGSVAAFIGLGICLQESGDIDGAVDQYAQALERDPNSAAALTNLGLARSAQGDPEKGKAALEKASILDPDSAETHCALGSIMQILGDAEQAASSFERAIEIAPEDAKGWSNLGNARQDQLRLDDALAAHDRAVALAPADADVHWNRAMTLLLAGDFARGFAEYEWRAGTANHAPPTHASPRWEGDDPSGLRLLLLAEQGFGDAIQFVRYAPLLAARGTDIVIQCHPKLTSLFETLDGGAAVVAAGEPLPNIDAHIPLMSLPYLLGTTASTIPADIPYLHVPVGTRTPPATNGRRRIGLCWAGNPGHPDNAHRSCPFRELVPLLDRQEYEWRSLQFDISAAQATDHIPNDPAWNLSLDGFANTAATLRSCDLIITVDTATAHLAGALGRPVWLLLKYSPDWRWMVGRDDSPWYPTARLFRQSAPGDWTGVVARLESALDIWMEP